MGLWQRGVLIVLVAGWLADAEGQIPKDATAHHPDGTPIFPEALRTLLREALAAGKGVPAGIREHVEGDE